MPEKIDVLIRNAVQDDAKTIKRMVRSEHLDPTSLNWEHFLVAEHEGKIVGIGQIKPYPGCNELGSLVTRRSFRGHGVASQLIEALEERAGYPVYLFCRWEMAAYYRRFGYENIRWRDAPGFLKIKGALPMLFRFFGIRIVMMKKGRKE